MLVVITIYIFSSCHFRQLLIYPCKTIGQEVEVVAGASWKILPDIISYEATIPVTYILPWSGNTSPASPNLKIDCIEHEDVNCKILSQIEEISKAVNKEVNGIIEYWNITHLSFQSRSKRSLSLSFVADGLNWCCGVATQQKFDSMVMDTNEVKQRVSSLHAGLDSVVHVVSKELSDMENFQKEANINLEKLESKIKNLEYYTENVSGDLHIMWAALEKTYMDVSKNMLSITKAIKIQNAVETCRNQKIPTSIIAPSILREDLKKIK